MLGISCKNYVPTQANYMFMLQLVRFPKSRRRMILPATMTWEVSGNHGMEGQILR